MGNGISTQRSDAKVAAIGRATVSRRGRGATSGQGDIVGDESYSFLVVEESLPTETIAEYRRSRAPRRRPRAWRIGRLIVARLRWVCSEV